MASHSHTHAHTRTRTHSLTHSRTHARTHSLTYSFTQSFLNIPSFHHSLVQSFIRWLNLRSLVRSFIPSVLQSFIQSVQFFIRSCSQSFTHSLVLSFCFFNRLISCHLFHQFRLFSVHSNHSVCSIPVFPLALPFVHSLVRSNSCYFNSTQVCTRSFHAISRPFMLDSFIQSFSRFWILSCYWFHLLSCHLVGISKTT